MMPVPNEITFTDMSHLFLTAECNGQGTRHVQDGALTRVHPCYCPTCESGKAERKQAKERAYQEGIAKARRIIDEYRNRNGESGKTY